MQLPPSTNCTFVSVNATFLHLQFDSDLGPSEHAYLTSLPPLRTDRLRLSGVYIELMWAAAAVSPLAKTSPGLRIDISFHLSNAAAAAGCGDANSLVIIVHRPSSHVFAPAELERERKREEKHLVVPASSSLQSDRRRIPRVPDARGKLLFSLFPSPSCSRNSLSPPLEILSDHLSARIRPPHGSWAAKKQTSQGDSTTFGPPHLYKFIVGKIHYS